jgi:hypothetical protein
MRIHSTYHPDADLDSDFYLMRIRIRLFDANQGYNNDADPQHCLKRWQQQSSLQQISIAGTYSYCGKLLVCVCVCVRVIYSALLHLSSLRIDRVRGCWD